MSGEHEQLYSEKQVAQVLRRAAELQERQGEGARPSGGASRGEIERIGEEVGIDPQHVATALAELDLVWVDEDHRGQSHWLGAPPEYVVERALPGTLTPEGWDTLVGLLNSEFKQSQAGMTNGTIRTWRWEHELGHVHFSAIQLNGSVRLRMTLHFDEAIVAGLVPAVIAWFAITSLLFSADSLRPWLSIILSAVALVALAAGFRAYTSAWWRKDQRRTTRLMDRLVQAVAPSQASPSILTSQPEEPETPLHDLA